MQHDDQSWIHKRYSFGPGQKWPRLEYSARYCKLQVKLTRLQVKLTRQRYAAACMGTAAVAARLWISADPTKQRDLDKMRVAVCVSGARDVPRSNPSMQAAAREAVPRPPLWPWPALVERVTLFPAVRGGLNRTVSPRCKSRSKQEREKEHDAWRFIPLHIPVPWRPWRGGAVGPDKGPRAHADTDLRPAVEDPLLGVCGLWVMGCGVWGEARSGAYGTAMQCTDALCCAVAVGG
jgi:hypothetical protein